MIGPEGSTENQIPSLTLKVERWNLSGREFLRVSCPEVGIGQARPINENGNIIKGLVRSIEAIVEVANREEEWVKTTNPELLQLAKQIQAAREKGLTIAEMFGKRN